jgi:hypothetical protein
MPPKAPVGGKRKQDLKEEVQQLENAKKAKREELSEASKAVNAAKKALAEALSHKKKVQKELEKLGENVRGTDKAFKERNPKDLQPGKNFICVRYLSGVCHASRHAHRVVQC